MNEIAVVSTFPDHAWDNYARQFLKSFVQYWPQDINLMLELDGPSLDQQVHSILRQQDEVALGWMQEHISFVLRNKAKDDHQNYRKQAVRFCHKVFALKRALDANAESKKNGEPHARYFIWMDADVHTLRPVTMDEIRKCLPKPGDAVAYLGRKDWDHSECGWLAFDLDNKGADIIDAMYEAYRTDAVFNYEQWHDSYIFDRVLETGLKGTNLTEGKPGMEIWSQSPMAAWSTHFKGPQAKHRLANGNEKVQIPQRTMGGSNVMIQTKNAIPHEEICNNIRMNQRLITKWIAPCTPTDEEVVIVSAGPQMVAEDVLPEYEAGKKIVAVKHALQPLKDAGIKPWATILLDPRPHVADFVKEADPDILWFVASQVDPKVTEILLERGCTIWGYHAAVGAGEHDIIAKQGHAVVIGGSATATRGMYVLGALGFKNFNLYGYDLCYPDKVDLHAVDDKGQPKYFEISVGINSPVYPLKKVYWTEPQLIAQYEELQAIIAQGRFNLKANGQGIAPFIIRAKELVDLRTRRLQGKMPQPVHYEKLLRWNSSRKTPLSTKLRRLLPQTLRRQRAGSRL